MTPFATDLDLLHWEPHLLRDASFASQTLISGTGTLAGTAFTISSGSFIDSKVKANQLIKLAAPFDGTYPIVTVGSATQLTMSVMYDGLFPDTGAPVPGPIGSGAGLAYSVRTFWPQLSIASEMLIQAAGIASDDADSILNPQVLRRPCALGALQMIYSAIAAAAAEPDDFYARAELYERLFRRALRSATVEVDADGDGIPESRRSLNVLDLRRA